MATLRKRKKGDGFVYVIDFRVHGERHQLSTRTSERRLAEKVRGEIQGRIAKGLFRLDDYRRKDTRVAAFFKEYFERVEGTKRESTLAGERIYTRTFVQIVGDPFLREVKVEVLERWRAERLKRVKPVTVNIERRVLSMIFGKAVGYGYIERNPFQHLKKMREDERRLYLTSSEAGRLFEQLESNVQMSKRKNDRSMHYRFKLYCEVLLNTGMRRNELLRLTENQIDFGAGLITLENTKSRRTRQIPMTNRVKEILGELKPTLFQDLKPDVVSHKFRAAAGAAGIKGMKLHSLRHTFGTWLIAMGYDITVVQKLLGHEDIRTTMIYAKAEVGVLRNAIESFGKLSERGYKLATAGEEGDKKRLTQKENDKNVDAIARP